MTEIPDFDDRPWEPSEAPCEHGRTGYCFDCVRKRHNQDMLDGKFDDADEDFASTPHPSAHYEKGDRDV